jgi:hypothetical protein
MGTLKLTAERALRWFTSLSSIARITGIGLVVALIVLFSVNRSRARADRHRKEQAIAEITHKHNEANWRYWQQLGEISNNADKWSQEMEGNKSFGRAWKPENEADFDQATTFLKQAIERSKTFSDMVSSLPVLDVDPEPINYAAEMTNEFKQMTTAISESIGLLSNMKTLISDFKSLHKRAESGTEFFKAILRGIQFDLSPLSPEVKAEQKRLVARLEGLQKQFETLESRMNDTSRRSRLESSQLQVRSTLSRRYNREFPKLKLP